MRALIVGKGHERGSLAAARSLTAAGWEVGSGAPSGRGLVSLSRAVARRHEIPLISRDGDAFIAAVREVVRETSYDVIFSSSDAELLALSEARADLGAVFPYPPHGSLLSVLDKKQLDPRAREVGFNVPEVIEDPDGQLDRLGYPVVVKDRLHSARLGIGIERVEATAARDPSEAEEALLEVRAHGGEPVVQRFVPGALMAYVCLIDSEGTVVAECQQLAEAIWPHPAGVSTRSQTIPVDSAVAESARALLSGLRWQGLAEVQFIKSSGDDPFLIDINARFYGSLALAIAAGVDLPAMWADMAVGRSVEPVRAHPGVRYQWMEGDLRRSWALGRGERLSAFRVALGASGRSTHSIWSVRDPAPAVRHALGLTGRFLVKGAPWT